MKKLLVFLIFVLSSAGCSSSVAIPEDFSFTLTWGCFGVSSYDSRTEELVKTTDAKNPNDYITYYQLTDDDKEFIYNLISSLDVNSYPDVYDPTGSVSSIPPMMFILTVYRNDTNKTIKAEDVSLNSEPDDEKGEVFISVCGEICNRLTSTEEWKALPDYEKYYR